MEQELPSYLKRLLSRSWADAFKFADSWGINPKKAPFAFFIILVIAGVVWYGAEYTDSMHEKLVLGASTLGIVIFTFGLIHLFFVMRTPAILEREAIDDLKKRCEAKIAALQRQLDQAIKDRDEARVSLDEEVNKKASEPGQITDMLYRVGLFGRKLMELKSQHQDEWVDQACEIVEKALRFRQAELFRMNCPGMSTRECSEWLINRVQNINEKEINTSCKVHSEITRYRLFWLDKFMQTGNEIRGQTLDRTQRSIDISKPINEWIAHVVQFISVHLADFEGTFLNDGGLIVETYTGGAPTNQLTQKMDRRLARLSEIQKTILSNPNTEFR